MAAIPLTRNAAAPGKADAIRAAVKAVSFPENARRRIAAPEDAGALLALIGEPRVHEPIYTLPKPPTPAAVRDFISRHSAEKARGEGLLILSLDEGGAVDAYHDIQFWPQWSVCELGGAIRPDKQGRGTGAAGAAAAFDWLFNTIGVDLICETAALDNIRTRK